MPLVGQERKGVQQVEEEEGEGGLLLLGAAEAGGGGCRSRVAEGGPPLSWLLWSWVQLPPALLVSCSISHHVLVVYQSHTVACMCTSMQIKCMSTQTSCMYASAHMICMSSSSLHSGCCLYRLQQQLRIVKHPCSVQRLAYTTTKCVRHCSM